MEIEPAYELKFPLYDGNETGIAKLTNKFEELKEFYRNEGSVMSKVLSYFFEGLSADTAGDVQFWNGQLKEAHQKYTEAERMYHRFKNSRTVQARLDYYADRMLSRVTGKLKICEGFQMNDMKLKIQLFTEALTHFNQEVALANSMSETMSSYAAFGRASFAESQLLLYTVQQSDNVSGAAKKQLMNARNSIRQAAFIDTRYLTYLHEIVDALDDLTKNRILVKAEEFADLATIASENGEYSKAMDLFQKAGVFYKRASSLASDTSSRRYLLSTATIYEASELEAEGNELFRRENDTANAAKKYQEAAHLVAKAIALMGRFGSSVLENTFSSQRDYYKAMSLQAEAISLFDNENYADSKELFNQAIQKFQEAIEGSTKAENMILVDFCNEAIADINGYLSMADAMS